MTLILAKCITKTQDREFQVSEQLSTVIFDNPELLEAYIIEVDGCVFGEGDGERCDRLINVFQKNQHPG